MKAVKLLLFLGYFSTLWSQEVPNDYFSSPLDVPLVLSGTFGELRNNHFHAGIDIKTQGRTGLAVKASADGYIARINVNEYGYGKVLYINHPNGFQTVYAHLEGFAPEIEKYVKELQYQKESYVVQDFPEAKKLTIKKGEVIGFSGNSGSSGGPHLHFEIRDSKAQPMNPFNFGFQEIEDHIPPRINGVWVYTLDENAQVEGIQGRQRLTLKSSGENTFKTDKITAFGNIGFGVSTDDQLDKAINRNGIYRISTSLNGQTHFEVKFDKFSFGETRYINQYIDYGYAKEHKTNIQKLFSTDKPTQIYSNKVGDGILSFKYPQLTYQYQILVEDFAGNKREIIIPIETDSLAITQPKITKTTPYLVYANSASAFENDKIDLYFPKGSLYEDTYIDVQFHNDAVDVHDYRTPIHNKPTLGFDTSHLTEDFKEKAYIANVMPWGAKNYVATKRNKDRISAQISQFGRYEVAFDRTPPTIKPKNFRTKQWMSDYRFLSVEIDDAESGIDSYRASVNGKFILMEYEYKDKTLTYDFNDGIFEDGKNELKIVVRDKVGNTSTFEAEIYRKN